MKKHVDNSIKEIKEIVEEIESIERCHRDVLNQEPRILNPLREAKHAAKTKHDDLSAKPNGKTSQ